MLKKVIWVFVAVLVLVGGYFGYQHFFGEDKDRELLTTTATVGDIQDLVTATGKIEPKEYVDVGAQVSGQVTKVDVSVGDVVQRGDLLATIDRTLFQAKVDAIEAQLRYQKAQKVDRIAQKEVAKLQYDRHKKLFEGDAITAQELEDIQLRYRLAKAAVMMIEAQIDQTKSSLQEEMTNLEYTSIYAPMDGTVVSIATREGQTINANQQTPTILTIADLSKMQVYAEVSEADINSLESSMDLYFNTMGSNKRYYSVLDMIKPTPTISNNVVNYKAVFDVDNTDGELMPQMTAQVFFIIQEAKDAILVPASAISFTSMDRSTAKIVVQKGDRFVQKEVEVGVTDRVNAQILSGIDVGDTVVSSIQTYKTQHRGSK